MSTASDSSAGLPAAPASPGITINGRTLAYVAALLLGGGLGGGSVSIASNPAHALEQLQAEVGSLKQSVETVAVAAVEIKAQLRADRRDLERLETELGDHESRLRRLETAD